ncbi:hypothetical protein, partial [Amycolatopsis sp. CA-126428]|uniref:hypothetical protein n=1 Tax=Amycolatopsis sp. CA-126428 TaxID=2073158 RepID=UPI001E5E384A
TGDILPRKAEASHMRCQANPGQTLPRQTGTEIHGSERVQAAIVLLARGSIRRFRDAVTLSTQDWRDVLVAADLAHDDWPARLDQELGPVTSSEDGK